MGKKEIKLPQFWDYFIVYKENFKKSTPKKILELISEFSKITGYKINIQKSVVCLYINSEHMVTEIKNTIYNNSKNEILRGKSNKTCTGLNGWKYQNTGERNQRYGMSHMDMDWNPPLSKDKSW